MTTKTAIPPLTKQQAQKGFAFIKRIPDLANPYSWMGMGMVFFAVLLPLLGGPKAIPSSFVILLVAAFLRLTQTTRARLIETLEVSREQLEATRLQNNLLELNLKALRKHLGPSSEMARHSDEFDPQS
jgi:hypothetical protein